MAKNKKKKKKKKKANPLETEAADTAVSSFAERTSRSNVAAKMRGLLLGGGHTRPGRAVRVLELLHSVIEQYEPPLTSRREVKVEDHLESLVLDGKGPFRLTTEWKVWYDAASDAPTAARALLVDTSPNAADFVASLTFAERSSKTNVYLKMCKLLLEGRHTEQDRAVRILELLQSVFDQFDPPLSAARRGKVESHVESLILDEPGPFKPTPEWKVWYEVPRNARMAAPEMTAAAGANAGAMAISRSIAEPPSKTRLHRIVRELLKNGGHTERSRAIRVDELQEIVFHQFDPPLSDDGKEEVARLILCLLSTGPFILTSEWKMWYDVRLDKMA